jgi:hypothetical protein
MESPLDRDSLGRRLVELFALGEAPARRRMAWWVPAKGWPRK